MLIHYFAQNAAPVRGDKTACGRRFRGFDAYRPDLAHTPCPDCAALVRCECGALVGTERATMRLATCIDCARNAPAIKVAMHGDEDSGRVWTDARADADTVPTVPGGKLECVPMAPTPTGRPRDQHGRFYNPRPKLTGDYGGRELGPGTHFHRDSDDPTRIRAVDDWDLIAHDGTPIPGVPISQRTNVGAMRSRVKTQGTVRPSPWDRKPRDRGRRDFESPVEGPASRPLQENLDLRQAAADA